MTLLRSVSPMQSQRPQEDPPASGPTAIPTLSSAHLLGSAGEAVIEHGGQFYRLRRTDRGGLVLTK